VKESEGEEERKVLGLEMQRDLPGGVRGFPIVSTQGWITQNQPSGKWGQASPTLRAWGHLWGHQRTGVANR
jgi:hypothetical protein